MRHFYEQDGLHLRIYDTAFGGMPDVEFYRRLTARLDGPVLELGCGTGRVIGALAESGRRVFGLDRSAAALRIAGRRFECLVGRLVEGDMRAFAFARRFAAILIPFRGLEGVGPVADQLATLRCVARHLWRDGEALVHTERPRDPSTGYRPWTLAHGDGHVRVQLVSASTDGEVVREVWNFTHHVNGALVAEEEELLEYWPLEDDRLASIVEEAGLAIVEKASGFRARSVTDPKSSQRVWRLALPRGRPSAR